jgi:hypothetical protein
LHTIFCLPLGLKWQLLRKIIFAGCSNGVSQ